MKLRIEIIDKEDTIEGEVYLMAAYQAKGLSILTKPAKLQYQDAESGQWVDVEMYYELEFKPSGNVREVPAQIQVPVYRKDPGEGGEARGGRAGDRDSQDRGGRGEGGAPA